MAGLVDSATAIMSASERRLETTANNVSNLATPGFKRQISFTEALSESRPRSPGALQLRTRSDLAQSGVSGTGNPLDLAISGAGFFRLRDGAGFLYSRQGQFKIGEGGVVVTPQGQALQQAGGGDLVLDSPAVEITADGTVVADGRPIARIALYGPVEGAAVRPLAGSLFAMPEESVEEVPHAELRQGMIETSNVSLGDEMVAMMAALRQAESGARLVQLYDDLVGRAITAFGQGGR